MKPYELTEYETQACARYAYLKAEIKRLTEESEGYKATVAHCVNLRGTISTEFGRLTPTPSTTYPVPTAVQFRATTVMPIQEELKLFISEISEGLSNDGALTMEASIELDYIERGHEFRVEPLSGFPFSNRLFAMAANYRASIQSLEILEGLETTDAWKKDAVDLLKHEGVIKPETNHTVKFLPPLNVIPQLPKVPSRKSKAKAPAAAE